MVTKYTGWGMRGKPFTKTTFKKSRIKSTLFKKSGYKGYLASVERQKKDNPRTRSALKYAMK